MSKWCFIGFLCVQLFDFQIFAQKKEVVVVIDPGHGGHDPGHLSGDTSYQMEKELNLKIATFLGGYIEKYLQNVKVIYTRTDDTYPTLDDRVDKANANKADYFISIHCNGNDREEVYGTETHVHSFQQTKSVELARAIESQFSQRAGRKSRGVKDERDLQHSLQVLKFTNMPSVLVECGFLTNAKEASYLNTTYGQEIIASAIFRAFRATITKEFPSISFIRTESSTETEDSSAKYAIQIASSREPIASDDAQFRHLNLEVTRIELNTTSAYKYIYVLGSYSSKEEAKADLPKIKTAGYRDAIVIKR